MNPDDASAITYAICAPKDTEEMGQLLAEAFSRHDPPAVALGITAGELKELFKQFSSAGQEGLTTVARDSGTGEMAGAMLTEDAIAAPKLGTTRLTEKFDPIFDLLGQLDTKYRSGRTIRPGEYLHLLFLGVADEYARKGVAQTLVARCLENGLAKGYRMAMTEATNRVSQHIFRKLGFVERVKLSYGDYRHNGEAVFASIADHGGPISMDRHLVDSSADRPR